MKYLGIILALVGVVGWITSLLIGAGYGKVNQELPIVGVCGLLVDHHGNIYVASEMYHSIQVYDSNGKYLRMWQPEVYGGGYSMEFSGDSNIIVNTARDDLFLMYSQNGDLLKRIPGGSNYSSSKENEVFVDSEGKTYSSTFGFTSDITVHPPGKTVVSQNLFMKTMNPLVFFGFSLLMAFIFHDPLKLKKKYGV